MPPGFRVTTAASRGEPGAVAMAVRTAYAELGYPSFIRGSFDPFAWAADPDRRSDVWVQGGTPHAASGAITGFAGAAGAVEGPVRVLASVADGPALRPGEILVTTVTNVGWTPLFPLAAAVVTDVGAPLSHAAIVAGSWASRPWWGAGTRRCACAPGTGSGSTGPRGASRSGERRLARGG